MKYCIDVSGSMCTDRAFNQVDAILALAAATDESAQVFLYHGREPMVPTTINTWRLAAMMTSGGGTFTDCFYSEPGPGVFITDGDISPWDRPMPPDWTIAIVESNPKAAP